MTVAEQAEQVRKVKKYESGVVKDPITIEQGATIAALIELTTSHGISGVCPLLDGEDLVGIVDSQGPALRIRPQQTGFRHHDAPRKSWSR